MRIGRHATRQPDDAPEPGPASSQPGDTRAAHALALQQAIGNCSTARVLTRWPVPGRMLAQAPPVPGGSSRGTPVAGGPPVTTLAPPSPTPANAPATSPPSRLQILTPAARKVLRLDTKDQIAADLPLFLNALDDNVAAIKAHDKAKAEWAAAIVEICFGVAAPIFAKLLVNRGGVTQRFASQLSEITKTSETAKHLRTAKNAAEAAEVAEDMAWQAAKARAELTIAQDAVKAARGRSARKGAEKAMRQAEAGAKQAERRAEELGELATEAQEAPMPSSLRWSS